MINYTEQFCEAAKIIATGVVDERNFDKTIKATVLKSNDYDDEGNPKEKLNGEYLCMYENTTFLAYGSPCTYSPNEIVFINIPMGDWNNKKFIINNKNNINVIYSEGVFKAYDAQGNYIGDIGGGASYENYENKTW